MLCTSCQTEIDPKWKHALNQNICPFCGSLILQQHLKDCLSTLSSAMEEMSKYPDQLNDWLLSNYKYIKTDSPDLKFFISKDTVKELRREIDEEEYHEKKMTTIKIKNALGEEEEIEVESKKVQSDDRTKGFFDRAEVLKGSGKTSGRSPRGVGEPDAPKSVAEKTRHLAGLVQEIKTKSSQGIIDENGMASMISPEDLGNSDPATVSELESIIDAGSNAVLSGLGSTSSGDDDEIPSVVMNMASRAANKQSSNYNEKDMQTLREMQHKAATGSSRMESGKGKFSRG